MSTLLLLQGAYYGLTGLWPLLSMRSFERVTGEKTDDWLVKTVGALIVAVALPLLVAGERGQATPEIVLLAAGCAAALGLVDVVYSVKRVISPIYLLDAVVEAALVGAYVAAARA